MTNADAKEIDTVASQWIQRRYFWDWSEKEQVELDAWLAESFAHRAAYLRFADIWRRTERLAAVRAPLQPHVSRFHLRFLRVMAGVIAAGVIGAAAYLLATQPATQKYVTSIGGHENVVLADGSQIELNTDTFLRVSERSGERLVWLDRGEAYFQVHHNASRPFVVMADDRRITDLGTKFVVHNDAERLEVSLVEGRASFDGPDNQHAVLTPGDVALATAKSVFITRKAAAALDESLSWRRGLLVFNRTALSDAAAQFNRYNRREIVIADRDAGRQLIYGTFPTTDIDAFARLAQAVFRLRVDKRGNQIVISR